MKILVTGGHGQVAHDLIQAAKQSKHELIALSRHQLDITNPNIINELFSLHHPNIVINTAAYTAVDKAEKETKKALMINCDGAALIAKACQTANIPLIHLSTDFVFEGTLNVFYSENSECHPLNVYGDSKLQGECEVRQCLDHHIILRVSGVYGAHGNNFVKTILNLGKKHESLRVVADQLTSPTPATDIANTLLSIIDKIHRGENHWGTYHYCGNQTITWHAFAEMIFDITRQHQDLMVKHVEPVTTTEYAAPAPRPLHPILNCDKIQRIFGIKQADWQTTLPAFIKSMLDEKL